MSSTTTRSQVSGDMRTIYLIKRVELAVRARLDELLRPFQLTTLQYTALSVLARQDGLSSAQLARRSFVTPQAMNEMVGALERKGWVSRAPDPRNRRILRASLTPAGASLLQACEADVNRLEEEIFGDLTDAEHRRMRESLAACYRALTRAAAAR